MPLDARKTAHILSAVNKTLSGRQKTVVFAYQSGGSYSYSAISVIFRKLKIIDPEIPTIAGEAPRLQADALMIAPITTNFNGVVYVADTNTATALAVSQAPKYEVIEALTVGIVPTGTHVRALLRRLR